MGLDLFLSHLKPFQAKAKFQDHYAVPYKAETLTPSHDLDLGHLILQSNDWTDLLRNSVCLSDGLDEREFVISCLKD